MTNQTGPGEVDGETVANETGLEHGCLPTTGHSTKRGQTLFNLYGAQKRDAEMEQWNPIIKHSVAMCSPQSTNNHDPALIIPTKPPVRRCRRQIGWPSI